MADPQDQSPDYFICPHCGAEVPADATFCRQCGSDADTGWSEQADRWQADVPTVPGDDDDDFDYDEFVAREFPDQADRAGRRIGSRWATAVLVLVVTLALVIWLVFR